MNFLFLFLFLTNSFIHTHENRINQLLSQQLITCGEFDIRYLSKYNRERGDNYWI